MDARGKFGEHSRRFIEEDDINFDEAAESAVEKHRKFV